MESYLIGMTRGMTNKKVVPINPPLNIIMKIVVSQTFEVDKIHKFITKSRRISYQFEFHLDFFITKTPLQTKCSLITYQKAQRSNTYVQHYNL